LNRWLRYFEGITAMALSDGQITRAPAETFHERTLRLPRKRLCIRVLLLIFGKFFDIERIPFVKGIAPKILRKALPEVLVGQWDQTALTMAPKTVQLHSSDPQSHSEIDGHLIGEAEPGVWRKVKPFRIHARMLRKDARPRFCVLRLSRLAFDVPKIANLTK
jgi:hypothetical protein